MNAQKDGDGVYLKCHFAGIQSLPVFLKAGGFTPIREEENAVFGTQLYITSTYPKVAAPFNPPTLLLPVSPMPVTSSTPLTPEISYAPADSSPLRAWLEWAGFRFDPFGPLDAAADPHLSKYLVGHEAFERVWGDWPSWVFAPPGGGKTALRVRTAQACWVGQETNHPFPIPYIPPFLSWGHASPSLNDHLTALARAGATALFLALAHRPHWLFRLDDRARRTVRDVLDWNLPGPLSGYLDRCRQSQSLQPLREMLDSTSVLPDPPDAATLLRWCDALDTASDGASRPSSTTRWNMLCELLLETLGFCSIYVLVDGLDAAPETMANVQATVDCLTPLVPLVSDWAERRVFVKGFLPLEAQALLVNQFPTLVTRAHTAVVRWTPSLLAEVVRRRVYVASEGVFGSLDAVASPALRDVETILAKAILPLPREMLVLTQRVLEEHVWREGSRGRIQEEDVETAIQWYGSHQPQIIVEEMT
ncbi:MAG TPA: hypothetical protein EYP49_10445 [Anaerolineae bacterium]|nr:hypothetical protein [Anaerolineae bacterium]